MPKTIPEAVREICLFFPEAEATLSHGLPDFKVRGKSFASFCINHHGDGRVALWVRSPAGIQRLYTQLNPAAYFVPPYVGPRGWLGVELNKGLDWSQVVSRVREAYEHAAPASLAKRLADTPEFGPPDVEMSPEEIDPMRAERPRRILEKLGSLCARLPETSDSEAFGNPCWKAGKKTFVCVHSASGRLKLQFWVGVEQQAMLTSDPRYSIPSYIGHNGWIDLDIDQRIDWQEVESLLRVSYRHFALKRMLKALDGGH
jgi:predicted DNA-binding protein (MmcQ/YjbR family)